ncbi:MAG: type III secretion system gatekeeper subunit SctW [Candidatus Accumulibacter sp.]|jgi:type III secretion protein W|nr:type III secretion system gatekeeper subunit SctW [Accumulibacter sp.]
MDDKRTNRREEKTMVDFSIQNPVQQAGIRDAASAQGAARAVGEATGSLAGYQVKVAESPLASLTDAAEELTFGVDNTKELTLKERKTKEDGGARFLERVAEYQALMEKTRGQDAIKHLYAFLKDNHDPRAALAKAREWSGGDPGMAWAALKGAREALRDEADEAALAAIDTALAQLEESDGPAIRAGIQGTLEAERHSAPGESFEAGAIYRQAVCDTHENLEDMFAFVMEKYGEEGFEAGLDFLFRSLAADLASDQRSHEKTHLEAVGASLGRARILNGAHALVGRFLERCRAVHGIGCEWTPTDFLKEVITLQKNHFLAARDINTLIGKASPPDIEHEVLFFQELLGTSRSFSPLLFENAEERMKFIGAVQESVDAAIAREDEILLAQKG